MNKIMAAVLAAVSGSALLAGCSPTTETASTLTSAPPPTVWTGAPERSAATLHQFIIDNKLAEVPFRADEPGTPQIDFPLPPDWSSAGDRTPEWAYGAIVYDKATDPADPPFMVAIASKLTGDVDAEKILQYAPGQLNELPDFTPRGEPKKDSLSGFEAIDYVGTYVWDGKPRVVGQQTIVIPGEDALFVVQLNADAPKDEAQVVIDAVGVILDKTTITAPA